MAIYDLEAQIRPGGGFYPERRRMARRLRRTRLGSGQQSRLG